VNKLLASIPWWAWLLFAFVCWYIQLFIANWTDEEAISSWVMRGPFIAGMWIFALIGIIRFVKWVWEAV
jgi:hypothetical protein